MFDEYTNKDGKHKLLSRKQCWHSSYEQQNKGDWQIADYILLINPYFDSKSSNRYRVYNTNKAYQTMLVKYYS